MKTVSLKNTDDLTAYVRDVFGERNLTGTKIFQDEITWTVARAELIDFLTFLRDDASCRFTCLSDMTAVDLMTQTNRFAVVYHLKSLLLKRFVRVRTLTDIDIPVSSATSVFPVANWYEREIWDMFGVGFAGNDDLRCLLTDEKFKGEPLRKDFPVCGEKKLRYDASSGGFYYEPVRAALPANQAKVTELG